MNKPKPRGWWFYSREMTQKQKDKISKNHANVSGENNPNWRGGKTYADRMLRKSAKYQSFRKLVLARDRCCIECGSEKNLEVDHVKPKKLFPDLIFDVNNGRVLCNPCHRKTPTYGRRD